MPDNIVQVQKDLVNELLNNLPAGYTAKEVNLPNGSFTTPIDKKWLRVTTNLQPTENVAAGAEYKRTFGIFTVDIFHPVNTGELRALEDFNAIKALYEFNNVGAAKCEEVSININRTELAWFNVQADVQFYYEGY